MCSSGPTEQLLENIGYSLIETLFKRFTVLKKDYVDVINYLKLICETTHYIFSISENNFTLSFAAFDILNKCFSALFGMERVAKIHLLKRRGFSLNQEDFSDNLGLGKIKK